MAGVPRGAGHASTRPAPRALAERDADLSENLVAKEALATEAERLVPVGDLATAKASLRDIQERWEKVGHVPRADRERVEGRLRRVEQAIREAEEARWRRTQPGGPGARPGHGRAARGGDRQAREAG